MIGRTFVFTKRHARSVHDFDLRPLLRAFFARLAPARALPVEPTSLDTRRFNWGSDTAWRTAEGDGILLAQRTFGGSPGDGVDDVYLVTIGDDITLEVEQGTNYTQLSFVFELSATPEHIDVATDALLEIAAAHKLVATS